MFHKIDLKWNILYFCDWGGHLHDQNGETQCSIEFHHFFIFFVAAFVAKICHHAR